MGVLRESRQGGRKQGGRKQGGRKQERLTERFVSGPAGRESAPGIIF